MNRFPCIRTAAGACAFPALPGLAETPFTYETPMELSSTGDFDGDGRADLAVLDRETGALRVLLQQASGAFVADPVQWTGLEAPEALTVGKIRPAETKDRAMAASGRSNRVLSLTTAPAAVESVRLNGLLTPSALATLPGAGSPAPLLVATEQNDAPTPRIISPVSYPAPP